MSDPARTVPVEPAADSARTSRAELLAAQGRFGEAERMLAATLAASPGHEHALTTLVRIQMMQGRAAQASETIESAVGAGAKLTAGLLRLRGSLLLSQSRFDDAAAMFRDAVAADPADASAQHALAIALGRAGAHEAAIDAARAAIAKGHDPIAARLVLGRALWESGRASEAETEFRRIVAAQPTHAAAHTSLADSIWLRTGDFREATSALDASIVVAPRAPELRLLKARLFEGAGEPERAYAEVERGLAFAPNHVDLHLGAARASLAFDAPRALAHAEHALRYAPFPQNALAMLADALLANGQAMRAAATTERLLQIDADDGHAIAVLATAWRLLGDARYTSLYDYSAFVRSTTLDTPAGWSDLSSWLADLARALHGRHDAMRAHPIMQTLRAGTQIVLRIDRDTDPAIRALREAIGGPIERYVAALGTGTDRLRRRNTGRWRLAESWSVRLRSSGYHFNHYHGSGWLSSACYIELPPLAKGEGWLQFGAPCVATKPALSPDYFVAPEVGQLVLFPSWMWHGTVPFSAKAGGSRLTIAFDALPI